MPGGEPTLGEVARTLERLETEVARRLDQLAASMSQMVTRDLHDAHRAAMQEDIAELRSELRTELRGERERRAADRRMVVGAMLAAGLSLVVTLVGAALIIALGWKGVG